MSIEQFVIWLFLFGAGAGVVLGATLLVVAWMEQRVVGTTDPKELLLAKYTVSRDLFCFLAQVLVFIIVLVLLNFRRTDLHVHLQGDGTVTIPNADLEGSPLWIMGFCFLVTIYILAGNLYLGLKLRRDWKKKFFSASLVEKMP